MPTLVIDIYEPPEHMKTIQNLMAKYKPAGWNVTTDKMKVSDYSVGKVLGIERKTPGDFLSSLSSGRLEQQYQELSDNFTTAVVMVEGNISDLLFSPGRNFNPDSLTALIASMTVKHHVHVLFVGKKGTPHMVRWLALKAGDASSVAYTPIRPQASNADWQVFALSAYPGVGPEKAKALLAHYGTPLAALNAWDKWEEDVKGFGEKIGKRVGEIIAVRGQVPAQNAE